MRYQNYSETLASVTFVLCTVYVGVRHYFRSAEWEKDRTSWDGLDVGGPGPSVHAELEVPAGGGLWLGAVALAGLGLWRRGGEERGQRGQRDKRAVSFILSLFA